MTELWGLTHPWNPHDPKRPCFTCGAPPTHRFMDGSPAYGPECVHPPVYLDATQVPRSGPPLAITLTAKDLDLGATCADRIYAMCQAQYARGGKDRWGTPPSRPSLLKGTLGEIAFARLTGLPWRCRQGNFGGVDVGPYQVRTVKPSFPYLTVNSKDPNPVPIVLVIGVAPTYRIAGWFPRTGMAKQVHWIGRADLLPPGPWPVPGWMVPEAELHDPQTIPELAARA